MENKRVRKCTKCKDKIFYFYGDPTNSQIKTLKEWDSIKHKYVCKECIKTLNLKN